MMVVVVMMVMVMMMIDDNDDDDVNDGDDNDGGGGDDGDGDDDDWWWWWPICYFPLVDPPLLGNLTYTFLLVVPAANTTNGCDFNSSHGHWTIFCSQQNIEIPVVYVL